MHWNINKRYQGSQNPIVCSRTFLLLSLLCRRGWGTQLYTPNLSPNLLRDSRKYFSWVSAKDICACFTSIFGGGGGVGVWVPENSAWDNRGRGGTGLGTWLLVLGHSLQSLCSPPPLVGETETKVPLFIPLEQKTHLVIAISSSNVHWGRKETWLQIVQPGGKPLRISPHTYTC